MVGKREGGRGVRVGKRDSRARTNWPSRVVRDKSKPSILALMAGGGRAPMLRHGAMAEAKVLVCAMRNSRGVLLITRVIITASCSHYLPPVLNDSFLAME